MFTKSLTWPFSCPTRKMETETLLPLSTVNALSQFTLTENLVTEKSG